MAREMKITGMEEVSRLLSQLGAAAPEVAAAALYEGAKIVADAYSQAVDQIRTEPFTYKKRQRLPSPEEKAALQGATGIAKFKKDGAEVSTSVGLKRDAGYTQLGNSTVAVAAIANAINSGTSFMQKQPIYRRAKSTSRNAASEAIVRKANEEFDKIIKSNG